MDHSVSVLQFAEARASEIASLMTQMNSSEKSKKKTWFQNLPHHMRRRGASQNPKRVPKNLRGPNQNAAAKPTTKGKKHKKKPKDLKAEYAKRSKPENTWLENHIWHSKRFKMKNLWGYQLPLHSNDRKQGSSFSAAANRAMLQDLSYYCCIELNGVQEKLLRHLSSLADASTGHTFASEMFLDGSTEGCSFLYHPKSCPFKAIGSVSFIWKPILDEKTHEYKLEIPGDTLRKLWIWCHPSIHDELVEVLVNILDVKETPKLNRNPSDATEKETDNKPKPVHQFTFACKLNFTKNEQYFCKEKTFTSSDIKMVLRKNTLVRHRLIGPMSQSILTQVLRLADVTESSNSVEVEESTCENSAKRFKSDNSADLSDTNGNDQASSRLWWQSYFKCEHQKQVHGSKGELLSYLMDSESSYYVTPRSVIGLTVRDPRIEPGWRQENGNGSPEEPSKDLSKIDQLLTPQAADSAIWEDDIRNEVTATKLSDQEINNERSKCIGTVELGNKESRVPIMIIHQSGSNGFGSGWDIIAPLGWSLEFWRSFERKGGRPAGLRDLHIVNRESGRPSFPCSFPDTDAGAAYEEKIRTEDLTQFYRHPKSKRPNFAKLGINTPFFMCWKTLIKDWEKEIESPEICSLFPSVESLCAKDKSEKSSVCCREYYVLRQKELRHLGSLCACLNKTSKRGLSNETMGQLSDDFNKFVVSVPPQIQFSKSLIVLKINCMNKGSPSIHSGLYLLSDLDLEEAKNNPKFCGPTEPCHLPAKKPEMEKKNLERPQIDTLISASSRKMIGCVSEGGFSRLSGQGYAIGHCSSVGFLVLWKQCLEAHLRPLILIREQHCFKYRVGTVEIIENYL